MDESSLFHYASDSLLGPNGTGGRGRAGGQSGKVGGKFYMENQGDGADGYLLSIQAQPEHLCNLASPSAR